MGWNLTSHMYTTNFKNIFFLSRGVSRCYEDTCNSCSQLSYLSSSGPHVLTSSFHAYQCFGFHFLYKRNYNLAHVLLVPRSKRITCVCLHLGHSVHWRRLQTSGSHGLSSISTPADAPLLAEGEKSQTKIYWHCQLPWQADPQSQCPSHPGRGHPCVRCIMLIFPLDNHNFFQAVDKTNR